MKKTLILLLLIVISMGGYAQTKQKNVSYVNESHTPKSFLYIQLVALEDLGDDRVKFIVKIGDENKFYIKNDREFEIFDQIQSEIPTYRTIADALNYLVSKGFSVEFFNTTMVSGSLRHDIILARPTGK